ncbi:MAG: glycosyltransferase [Bacteroidales bacterium]
MISNSHRKVLVCPLDWGWGHASRMIPIIHLLSGNYGFEVILGISGSSGKMLQTEFPDLKTVAMPSFHITYSSGASQIGKIFWQLPKIIKTILLEHLYLKRLINKEHITCVVSDHRYGLFHKDLLSILVIHQLNVKFPGFLKHGEKIFVWIQSWFLRRFDQVWVPDFPGEESIAGSLSSPFPPVNHFYKIGILSRFLLPLEERIAEKKKPIDIVVVLSGPEPQRSLLEKTLIGQLEFTNYEVLFVRGITGEKTSVKRENIQWVSHLSYRDMAVAIAVSGIVICRSGYSSIMDLMALGKRAILIPTPGQTEQEYLAEYLKERGYFYSEKQKSFDIFHALAASRGFYPPKVSGFSPLLYERLNWLTNQLEKYKSKHKNG